MSGPTTEIRWVIIHQGHDQLAVDVSARRGPSFAEELIASNVIGLGDLSRDFPGHDNVTDLLKTWLVDDPSRWQADDPTGTMDPAEGSSHEDVVAEWGSFLGGLLVARVVGRRLDAIVQKAAAEAHGPTIRLLFALRGPVARRLPVELMLWPNGLLPGPIVRQRGLSVLREADPGGAAVPTQPSNKPRIVVAGVMAPGFVDADEWQRLAQGIDDHVPGDFQGRVGPGLTERPGDALHALGARSGDLAIVWGHGIRQVGEQSVVWPAPEGPATADDIALSLGDRYGAALVALCFSASEGEHGERSVVSRLVSSGVSFAVGFQGRPATTAVIGAVHTFVRSLRTEHHPGAEALDAFELALYRVRTEASDGHGVARQLVAEVAPHLTAGRRRRSPFYRDARLTAPQPVRAYRTAGQLLITRVDDHGLVRIPLPVDPLVFTVGIDRGVLRLDHFLPGLKSDLERALRSWDGLNLQVDVAGATLPVQAWGLQSAMLDAVIAEIERIVGERRPDAVGNLVCRARRKDWGSPPAMSVVQVQTGAVICILGPPPANVRADVACGAGGSETINLAPLATDVLNDRSPMQYAAKVDWQTVDRAVAGDADALERLIDDQLAVLRAWLVGTPLQRELGPLPDGCLAFPSLTRLVQREL